MEFPSPRCAFIARGKPLKSETQISLWNELQRFTIYTAKLYNLKTTRYFSL